jgi:hypothetical protein
VFTRRHEQSAALLRLFLGTEAGKERRRTEANTTVFIAGAIAVTSPSPLLAAVAVAVAVMATVAVVVAGKWTWGRHVSFCEEGRVLAAPDD